MLTVNANIGGLAMAFSYFCMFGIYGLIIYFGGWEINQWVHMRGPFVLMRHKINSSAEMDQETLTSHCELD